MYALWYGHTSVLKNTGEILLSVNENKHRDGRLTERKMNNRTAKKLVGLFVVVVLALVGLAVRITVINATEGEKYARIVMTQAQQQYDSRTIAFRRGDITDRNGTVLAASNLV